MLGEEQPVLTSSMTTLSLESCLNKMTIYGGCHLGKFSCCIHFRQPMSQDCCRVASIKMQNVWYIKRWLISNRWPFIHMNHTSLLHPFAATHTIIQTHHMVAKSIIMCYIEQPFRMQLSIGALYGGSPRLRVEFMSPVPICAFPMSILK